MTVPSDFWNVLAADHSLVENSYLDLPSLWHIVDEIHAPALVIGAGQGLIVAELQKKGIQCDGVDLSQEMVRHAKIRRGLDLIRADASAMPFGNETYRTVICATGVVDFMGDEKEIRLIMNEARRVTVQSGSIFVAFYKLSAATEVFLVRLGLLQNNTLRYREILEIYRLEPIQGLAWIAKRARVGYILAGIMALRSWAFSTWQEKRNAFRMQKIFARRDRADALINAAPEEQPYRNEAEIRNLFARLGIPIKQLGTFGNCVIVKV